MVRPPGRRAGDALARQGLRMSGHCHRCGSPSSSSESAAGCASCQLPGPLTGTGAVPVAAAAWLSAADRIGAGGDLGTILRTYRHASELTQQQLGDLLGFDRTYISM